MYMAKSMYIWKEILFLSDGACCGAMAVCSSEKKG